MDKQTRAPETSKRSYTSPEIRIYGNLAHITTTLNAMNNMDNGTGNNSKTS